MATERVKESARAAAKPERVTTVELDAKPAQAKVTREGFKVPAAKVNPSKAEFFLDNLEAVAPKDEPRVVSQSVPAESLVPVGTTIDLILAPGKDIPFDLFAQPHRDVRERKLQEVNDGILTDPKTRETLLRYDRAEDVSPADRDFLIKRFAQAGVKVDDANADTSFAAAFDSMRNALAFR